MNKDRFVECAQKGLLKFRAIFKPFHPNEKIRKYMEKKIELAGEKVSIDYEIKEIQIIHGDNIVGKVFPDDICNVYPRGKSVCTIGPKGLSSLEYYKLIKMFEDKEVQETVFLSNPDNKFEKRFVYFLKTSYEVDSRRLTMGALIDDIQFTGEEVVISEEDKIYFYTYPTLREIKDERGNFGELESRRVGEVVFQGKRVLTIEDLDAYMKISDYSHG